MYICGFVDFTFAQMFESILNEEEAKHLQNDLLTKAKKKKKTLSLKQQRFR